MQVNTVNFIVVKRGGLERGIGRQVILDILRIELGKVELLHKGDHWVRVKLRNV